MNKVFKSYFVSSIIILIFAFAIFIRLWDLDKMAYHHDESIHGVFSHNIYQGRTYRYSPVYHGPFLYHFSSFFFLIFGDSNYTGRLPYALIGIFLLYILYLLKNIIGKPRTFWIIILCALSPTLTYYSRFARNDIYMACWIVAIVTFTLYYIKFQKLKYLLLAVIFLGLLYCTKENSYMSGFIVCSYFVIYIAVNLIFSSQEKRVLLLTKIFSTYHLLTKIIITYGLFSIFMFFFVKIPLFASNEAIKGISGYLSNAKIMHIWNMWTHNHKVYLWAWWIFAFLVFCGVFYYLEKKRSTYSNEYRINNCFKDNIFFIISILLLLTIYSFLFTNMFHQSAGMKSGIIDYLAYWFGQQARPRIYHADGGFYYLPLLFLYETLAMIFATSAAFYYIYKLIKKTINRNKQHNDQSEPHAIPLFLTYWFLSAVIIYQILREHVPWLMTHQVLPASLLAGYFIGDLQKIIMSSYKKAIILSFIILGLSYGAWTNVLANLYNNDNPEEAIVYTHTNKDLKNIVAEVEELAIKWRTGYLTPITIQGECVWPLRWYFRNYKRISWPRIITKMKDRVVFADVRTKNDLSKLIYDNYSERILNLRSWWVPDKLLKQPKWWVKLKDYILYRKTWSPTGSTKFKVYMLKR